MKTIVNILIKRDGLSRDEAQEKTQEGIVLAVGDDKDAIKVKAKDHVIYDKDSPSLVTSSP